MLNHQSSGDSSKPPVAKSVAVEGRKDERGHPEGSLAARVAHAKIFYRPSPGYRLL